MNRQELIETLSESQELTKAATGRFLDALLETVIATVKKGDSVQLVGFGTFKPIKRAARTSRNPQTQAPMKLPASIVPRFAAGAKFKAAVDPKNAKRKAAAKTKAK